MTRRTSRKTAPAASPICSGEEVEAPCSGSSCPDTAQLADLLARCSRSLAWLLRSSARPGASELEELASAFRELASRHPWLLALLPWLRGLASLAPVLDRFPRSVAVSVSFGAVSPGGSVGEHGDPEATGL